MTTPSSPLHVKQQSTEGRGADWWLTDTAPEWWSYDLLRDAHYYAVARLRSLEAAASPPPQDQTR